MSRKQKAKTPQPQKGPKQHGMKTPQSAPAANKQGKKTADQNTLAQAKPTPKAGDKRKLDSSLANHTPKKNSTPLVSAKEKNTPAKMPKSPQMIKAPGGKKTPQIKTPAFSAKAKKTPQKHASDEDDDDDDDDIDFENVDFDEDSEDDANEESLEENMDDDDDNDDDDDDEDDDDDDDEDVPDEVVGDSKKGKVLKADGTMNLSEDEDDDDDEDYDQNIASLMEMSDDDDDDDDEDDEEDAREDDSDEDVDEDAILKSVQKLQKASGKQAAVGGKQKVQVMEKKAEQLPAANKKQEKKDEHAAKAEKNNQKQQRQSEGGKQSQKTEDKVQKQPQPAAKNKEIVKQAVEKKANKKQDKKGEQAAKVAVPDASNDAKRKEDHDKCTLFVKNLAPGTTTKDIKELSKDIKDVRLRITIRGKKENRMKTGFAFVEFATEALADKNYKILQGKSVKGSELLVDYVGQKSSFLAKNPKKETVDPDPLRLYITGFGSDVKDEDLYKLFPKAQEITVPVKKSDSLAFGYAFATFATPEQCKAAHKKGQGAKVHSHYLVVLYAKKRTQEQKKKDNKKKKNKSKENEKKKEKSQSPAKKAKLEVEEEEDDNDDDGEDDDVDSEGDGNSGDEGAGVMGARDDEDEEDDDEDEDDSDDDE